MNIIQSIRVIRTEDQVVQFTYIKEFGVFCGIFISDFVIGQNPKLDNDFVDYNLVLAEDCESTLAQLPAHHTVGANTLAKSYDLSSRDKRVRFGKKFKKLFLTFPGLEKWEKDELSDLKIVLDDFIKNDFAYHDYLLHTLDGSLGIDKKVIMLEVFKNCANDLYSTHSTVDGLLHRRYAFFCCAYKIDIVNQFLEYDYEYNTEKIAIITHEYANLNDNFIAGIVLGGLIGISRRKCYNYGTSYLEEALAKIGNNKYSDFVYYALAHFLEEQKESKAYELYEFMLNVNPNNYLARFKHAVNLYKKKEDFSEFIPLYRDLKAQINKEWATPIEIEIYYRCASVLRVATSDTFAKDVSQDELKRRRNKAFVNSKFSENFLFNDGLKESLTRSFAKKLN